MNTITERYAYLIIANRNRDQIQKLLTLLDDSRNDIYLLVDEKSNLVNIRFHLNYSNIYYLQPIKISWGSYSQIQAELNLFKVACKEHYEYYHLMSGQGLPLVNQDIIHHFFDNHQHREFIQYQNEDKETINDKLNSHLFTTHYDDGIHSEHSTKPYLERILWSVYRNFETIFNKHRTEHNIPMDKVSTGSTWLSIDDELVNTIVKSTQWIFDHFNRSKVSDELFIPTLINYHLNILNKVNDKKEYKYTPTNPNSNLRYIRKTAEAPHPKTWTINDYKELKNAKYKGYLFSRKFDEKVDNKIINAVFYDVMNS